MKPVQSFKIATFILLLHFLLAFPMVVGYFVFTIYRAIAKRPLKNAQFCFSSRRVKILTGGIR